MKVITKWEKEKLRFISNNELHKSINMDGHEDIGGEDSAMTPMEILLAALAGCMGINIVKILRRELENIESIEFHLEGRQKDQHPRPFDSITFTTLVQGDVKLEKIQRAVQLSHEKYCSVANSLDPSIQMDFPIELNGSIYMS